MLRIRFYESRDFNRVAMNACELKRPWSLPWTGDRGEMKSERTKGNLDTFVNRVNQRFSGRSRRKRKI